MALRLERGLRLAARCAPPGRALWVTTAAASQERHFSASSPRRQSDEERYIQYSKVPTLHFQPSLPRLPIPKLANTCRRYLDALRPVVEAGQFQKTEQLVAEFGKTGGDGDALNTQLRRKDWLNKHTSYISGPWFDMYLASRDPLVLNYNPFMAFSDDPRNPDQADRATNFIRSAVRFRASLLDNKLEPEIFHLKPEKSDTQRFRNFIRYVPSRLSWYAALLVKAFPLDMSQYGRLLGSTRIPCRGRDQLVSHGNSRHVLIMRNGHFYTLEAMQPDGLPTLSAKVHSQLAWILSQPDALPPHPLGYLTAINRDQWAELHQELVSNEENKAALEQIDSALFVLCLDDQRPQTPEEASHQLLHNYGANRWFDKSFSLIVTEGGLSAINFEHAWGDGVAVLRLMNEVYRDTTQNPYVPPATPPSPSGEGVERLQFQLSDRLKSAAEAARSEVESRTRDLNINIVQYRRFGKNLIKAKGLSPDAIMQLAFQIAYYRQYKCSVPTYESCSTAAFRHGRTETIRSATAASKACAEAFEGGHPAGAEEMGQLVAENSKWHSKLVQEAAMGQGFDRHLFALRVLAEAEGRSVPLFEDPSYAHLNHIVLSTSTLSSAAVQLGGFAPVTPDGYGVGYRIEDEMLGCNLSTYPTRDGPEFIANLQTVLDELHDVLSGRNFKQ